MADRTSATNRFYELMDRLAAQVGGPRRLQCCSAAMNWPTRGVYFFCERGEDRSSSGQNLRIVRVGTHALKAGAKSTLWRRLSQHRGTLRSGRGNHRGSVFRRLVGSALASQCRTALPDSWSVGSSIREAATKLDVERAAIKEAEADLESRVSDYIGQMPFLWLNVDDAPGPESDRDVIERKLDRAA